MPEYRTHKSENMKDVHDGWILSQMKKGEPIPHIQVKEGLDGSARIAKASARAVRNAVAIIDFQIQRMYKRRDNGNVAFFYVMNSDFNGITVKQMNIAVEMLQATFENDFQSNFIEYGAEMAASLDAKVDPSRNAIYIYFELKFENAWQPTDDFQEVE